MNWDTFLVALHILGTVFGAGGVTFAGIFYILKRDNDAVTPLDQHFLKTVYTVLRTGMILIVLSGFGFFLEFRLEGYASRLQSPTMWAKLLITVVILINSFLHHYKRLPLLLSSTISAVSWYAALLLGVYRRWHPDFWVIALLYVGAIVITYAVLKRIKRDPPVLA